MTYAANGESGLFKTVTALGKTLGIGAAILVTPAIYSRTREPMMQYFAEAWGHSIGRWLTWIMAGVEAFALYHITTLLFTAIITGAMAKAAARNFSGE